MAVVLPFLTGEISLFSLVDLLTPLHLLLLLSGEFAHFVASSDFATSFFPHIRRINSVAGSSEF